MYVFQHSGWYCRVTFTGNLWGLAIDQEEPEDGDYTHHWDPDSDVFVMCNPPEEMPEEARSALRQWLRGLR